MCTQASESNNTNTTEDMGIVTSKLIKPPCLPAAVWSLVSPIEIYNNDLMPKIMFTHIKLLFLSRIVLTLWDFSHGKFWGTFPRESQLQQLCYLAYGACWVLQYLKNSLNSDMDYRIVNLGCTDTRKRVCAESRLSGENSLTALGNWTCVSSMPVRYSTNWAISLPDYCIQNVPRWQRLLFNFAQQVSEPMLQANPMYTMQRV